MPSDEDYSTSTSKRSSGNSKFEHSHSYWSTPTIWRTKMTPYATKQTLQPLEEIATMTTIAETEVSTIAGKDLGLTSMTTEDTTWSRTVSLGSEMEDTGMT